MSLDLSRESLAAMVDHTILTPEAGRRRVAEVTAEAVSMGCASVCVQPEMVQYAAEVSGRRTTVCSVVGFPHGANLSEVKAVEAACAVAAGAGEIDMVADLSAIADGDDTAVAADVARVRAAVPHVVLKVILESALWSPVQLRGAVAASVGAGADFVKTSTGFHPAGGASTEAIEAMAATCAGRARVKASGGIRDLATARAMIDAGADRLGLSGTQAILDEFASAD
ncbi:MAG: deoxyribose-phosphate aldolase [Actinomycetia bacterium]|nr:deoxyribose-phosphate aldolase [Actinomycetes bacterium]